MCLAVAHAWTCPPAHRNLTNDGICGTFQFTNSSADIKLNPCDENGEPLVPPPPSGGDTFATWVLLVVILPSILLLSTSISCFALVLHKRRQGAAQTEHEPLPPATGTALGAPSGRLPNSVPA